MTTQRISFGIVRGGGSSPWAAGILRIILMGKLLTAFVAIAVLRGMAQTDAELQTYFKQYIGLSQSQIAAIRNGQPVAKHLDPRIPDEIFVFGAVYINAAPDSYIKFANDFERLRKLPGYLALRKFSNPPQLSDLKGFELDSDDIKALKKCKPGDCEIQMPASAMEEIPKSINWSAPNVGDQVNQLAQKKILQGLIAYQSKGNQVLGEYNDKPDPAIVHEQFKYMISNTKALPKLLPDFYRYLLTYPDSKPANVEDTFHWAKVRFGLKPTMRIVHVMTMCGNNSHELAYVIAEKQLYSSHYFETALDLTFCIRISDGPKQSGFYLIKAMGSEQAGLSGFKGSIVRTVALRKSVSTLKNSLKAIKNTLEQNK
jgi:hypothetical protein